MNIKVKGKHNFRFLFGATALTISPNVYIREDRWLKMSKQEKDELLVHENVHVDQQHGKKFKWLLKYVFSKKFRYSQELEAYKRELRFCVIQKKLTETEKKYLAADLAKQMSSSTYFGMCTANRALSDLLA